MSLEASLAARGLHLKAIGNPSDERSPKNSNNNAAPGAAAAGARALATRAAAFYFRAPVKAFFRTRVDYLAYAKSINPRVQTGKYSWRTTTPGLLTHAVKTHGWRFIPEQVLPPLLANAAVGTILYTSYLQILGMLHEPAARQSTKHAVSPPAPTATFAAGCFAGAIQSFIAAPLDALQVRFEKREKYYEQKSMWAYARGKLQDIGVRGIFAGWGLSVLKDSVGAGIFFSVFEYVKAQSYYQFIAAYYGSLELETVARLAEVGDVSANSSRTTSEHETPTIRPHYVVAPSFLMLAGVAASIAQQGIIYPLDKVQTIHYERLEDLDMKARTYQGSPGRARMVVTMEAYYRAYRQTWQQCKMQAAGAGGLGRWLFRGFLWNSIKQTPATSAGLVIFELVRRRYGMGNEEVKISANGYEILLA